MRRKVLHLAAVVSVVLCVATVALWARSYRHVDLLGREGRETADRWQRGGYASSGVGSLNVEWWVRQNGPSTSRSEPGWAYISWPVPSAVPAQSWHHFRFEATSFDNSRPTSDARPVPKRMTYSHRVTVPHWFVLLLTVAPIALWLRDWARRRRRLREDLCPACGYDLRATPGRCPECGAVPDAAPRTAA